MTLYYITEDADKGSVAPGSESLSPATGEAKGSTATPAAGYKFKNWTVDGEEVSTSATITKDAIDKVAKASGAYVETTFTANFEPDEKQTAAVTYTAQTGGSVTNEGDTIQIVTANGLEGSEAKAAAGYRFAGWYKGETQITEAEVLSKETAKANLNTDADTGRYADTTFVAKFEPNPEATVLVSYVSEDETKGTVTNGDGDEIQIVTGETLEGSTAAANEGYAFAGWYNGENKVGDNRTLTAEEAKAGLNKDTDGTYKETTFTAHWKGLEVEKTVISIVDKDNKAKETDAALSLGDTVTYEIKVTNIGTVPLTDIVVSDAKDVALEEGNWKISSLNAGQFETLTVTYVVKETDLGSDFTNTATAKVTNDPDVPVKPGEVTNPTDEIEKSYTVDKTASTSENESGKFKVGDVIEYTITVENTGNQTLDLTLEDTLNAAGTIENVQVTEENTSYSSNGKITTFTIRQLAPEGIATIKYQYTVLQGDVGNTITNAVVGNKPDPEDRKSRRKMTQKAK